MLTSILEWLSANENDKRRKNDDGAQNGVRSSWCSRDDVFIESNGNERLTGCESENSRMMTANRKNQDPDGSGKNGDIVGLMLAWWRAMLMLTTYTWLAFNMASHCWRLRILKPRNSICLQQEQKSKLETKSTDRDSSDRLHWNNRSSSHNQQHSQCSHKNRSN